MFGVIIKCNGEGSGGRGGSRDETEMERDGREAWGGEEGSKYVKVDRKNGGRGKK